MEEKEQESIIFIFFYDLRTDKKLIEEMKKINGVSSMFTSRKRMCHLTKNKKGIKVEKIPAFVVSAGETKVYYNKDDFLKILKEACPACVH